MIRKKIILLIYFLLLILLFAFICSCEKVNNKAQNEEYDEDIYPVIAKTVDLDGNIVKDIQYGDFIIRKIEKAFDSSSNEYYLIKYTGNSVDLEFPNGYAGHDYTLKRNVFTQTNLYETVEDMTVLDRYKHFNRIDFHYVNNIEELYGGNIIVDAIVCKDTQTEKIKNITRNTKELEVYSTKKNSEICNWSGKLESIEVKQLNEKNTRSVTLTGTLAAKPIKVIIDSSMYFVAFNYDGDIDSMVIEEGAYLVSGYESATNLTVSRGSVNLEKVLVGNNHIKNLNITNYDESIEELGNVFFEYNNNKYKNTIESITADDTNEKYKTIDGVLFDKEVTKLICYPMEKKDTEYKFPKTVRMVNAAFMINDNLQQLNLNNAEYFYSYGRGEGEYNYPFSNLSKLEAIKVSDNHAIYYAEDGVLYDALFGRLIYYPQARDFTKYEIPSFVKMIDRYAFDEKCKLKSVVVSGQVNSTTLAMQNLQNLENVELNNNCELINHRAFANCKNLSKFVISNTLTYIGEEVFDGCNLLNTIIFNGTKAQWEAIEKSRNWNSGSIVKKIQCDDGDIELI